MVIGLLLLQTKSELPHPYQTDEQKHPSSFRLKKSGENVSLFLHLPTLLILMVFTSYFFSYYDEVFCKLRKGDGFSLLLPFFSRCIEAVTFALFCLGLHIFILAGFCGTFFFTFFRLFPSDGKDCPFRNSDLVT